MSSLLLSTLINASKSSSRPFCFFPYFLPKALFHKYPCAAAHRNFCGLDTLSARLVRLLLRNRKLLENHGAGNRSHYVLVNAEAKLQTTLCSENSVLQPEHAALPYEQKLRIDAESLRAKIRPLFFRKPETIVQPTSPLGKSVAYLRNKHLSQMLQNGTLKFLYQESAKHPHQAYFAAVQKVLVKRLKLSPEWVSSQLSAFTVRKFGALFEASLNFESATDLES